MILASVNRTPFAFRANESKACRQAHTPAPLINWEGGELLLTFPFGEDYLAALPAAVNESDQVAAASGKGLGKDPADTTQKTTQKNSAAGDGLGKGLGKGLGESAQAICAAMQDQPTITIPELAAALAISTTAVEKHLKALREAGLVQRIGGRKHGHWEIQL